MTGIACDVGSPACNGVEGGHIGPLMSATRDLDGGVNPFGNYGFKWTVKAVRVGTSRLNGDMFFKVYR